MIKRKHVVSNFFAEAEAMRQMLDARFKEPYANGISWDYFCDPRLYTYLRTSPKAVFSQDLYERFIHALRQWCMENLGLAPTQAPTLHLMINGCRLALHSDYQNGTWGYVYSLTRWEGRRFSGGETLIFRDEPPSYKKHHVHGEDLYDLIPAHFNQLLVFDDRIVHGTPTIEGSMDPLDGRIALVGHIRATSLVVTGNLPWSAARKVVLDSLPHLRERTRSYRDVQGTVAFRLTISASGSVESVIALTENLVTPLTGYAPSDAVAAAKLLIQQTVSRLKFPAAEGPSTLIMAVLLPFPELRPIEFAVPHNSSPEAIYEWAVTHSGGFGELVLQGDWEGRRTYLVREPVAGCLRIEPREIVASFDPPMWVSSQRERFEVILAEWARAAAAGAAH